MSNINFSNIQLKKLITHHIGNKLRDEKLILFNEESNVNEDTIDYLMQYFFRPLNYDEVYSFTHSVNLSMNDVFSLAKELFSSPHNFIDNSQGIAKLLYEHSTHPKIKEGELHIAMFDNALWEDKKVKLIGIFKSENKIPFLQIRNTKSKFNITHEKGFQITGADKGCIIINDNSKDGYRVFIFDNNNNSSEALYWKDDFLKIKALNNEFIQTKDFISLTKKFVTKQLQTEFEISKADQIDLLNRSVNYFKTNNHFIKNEFENEVLNDENLIGSFRKYASDFSKESNIEYFDNFDISPKAVKESIKKLKGVIKLDSNFDIYIHGNKNLIEKGVEKDGRKYYKIYFENEV